MAVSALYGDRDRVSEDMERQRNWHTNTSLPGGVAEYRLFSLDNALPLWAHVFYKISLEKSILTKSCEIHTGPGTHVPDPVFFSV